MARPAAPRYRPIRDQALIGDCHGSALVDRDGTIAWATLHRFDADPVFFSLLDAKRGGHWTIRPRGDYKASRAYLRGTNMLRTVFETAGGSVAVTDYMPVGRQLSASLFDYVHLNAPGWIVRRIDGLDGEVTLDVDYKCSRDFGRSPVELIGGDGALRAGIEMPTLYAQVDFSVDGDRAQGRLEVRGGERHELVLADNMVEGQWPTTRCAEFFDVTRAFWEEWIDFCRYQGPHEEAVRRSALVLKLMTYAPTGAMVAAPTTSLPEEIGGERNWDYRFCWVRDASFALYALAVLGYSGEARCFHDFLLHAAKRSLPYVRPMYGIGGELRLDEIDYHELDGYAGSRPVRSGNGAYLQLQIDVYGQMLDLAHLYCALGGQLTDQYRRLLDAVAAFIAAHWGEPDQGLWEMRGEARHHVHGKLMSWTGMDRAARLLGPQWKPVADEIAAQIRGHVQQPGNGWLRQAYDGGADAAVLLAPMLGFELPAGSLERTIDEVVAALADGDFVARYDSEDGLAGGEGAFLVCSSWLADAELAAGRIDRGREIIERLLACANDVGLYAEEVDPSDNAFLGNFPQALTHLGLIGNLANLQMAERDGPAALRGTYADRATRAVTATFGWRAVLASMWQLRRVGRIVSSSRSKMAWP
ncbi:glycoside hydrolase family 15 protein [Piscinibacter sakaiensis]|uniref:glycoside hydrolase family 15 protein n=1 Tax=Piscinibacter sakaiensis TaxID=1547922 RepID=UPI003AAD784C